MRKMHLREPGSIEFPVNSIHLGTLTFDEGDPSSSVVISSLGNENRILRGEPMMGIASKTVMSARWEQSLGEWRDYEYVYVYIMSSRSIGWFCFDDMNIAP